ncbi:MAG: hypothetical protein KC776_07735 [Myxococcales bacterium]|nr:hypothetical protein [Myxococcales bacterium]MCB9583495.1 hypothetical protein [Polyangiaceae bacterium]
MGIDGIGKPPGAGIPPVQGPGKVGGTGETFKVDKPAAAEGAGPSEALSRLQRGEIGLDEYLDSSVTQATQALEGKLSPEQLEFVKSSLREQLSSDPVLVDLVRKATGIAPG